MTIGIAIINYNNGDFLRKAIDSAIGQSRVPDEVVICDDGSTDGSWEIALDYQARYPFVRVLRNEVNLGPSGNRDRAIRSCHTQFVMNMDGDDWFEAGVVEVTLGLLLANPDAMVISSFYMADEKNGVLDSLDTLPFCLSTARRQLYLIASRKRGIPGNQFAFSIDLYNRLGGLNTRLRMYEDWDWQIRAVIARVTWVHTGIFGYSYRKSGQGVSQIRQHKHIPFKFRVLMHNLWRSHFHLAYIRGVAALFLFKGMKYLSGRASPLGFN